MAHPTSPSLLARWARVRKGVARAPEPADMGTAYGMEWSLGQDPRMAEPAAASPSPAPGWFERWILYGLFPYPRRLRWALAPARLMQWLRLDRLIETLGLDRLLPEKLRRMQRLLPRLQARGPEIR